MGEYFCEIRIVDIRENFGWFLGEGVKLPTQDYFAEYDDRYFDRNVMRYSPYFERVRESRKKAELYTKFGIYPERYCQEHPLGDPEREVYSEAFYESCSEYRRIILNNDMEIILYNSDGSLFLREVDYELPEIFLTQNSFLATEDAPYYDFYISKGVEPELIERILKIKCYEDALGDDGGRLSFSYETLLHGGELIKTTNIDLKLYRRGDPETVGNSACKNK